MLLGLPKGLGVHDTLMFAVDYGHPIVALNDPICFFLRSALVPLHSLAALEGSLQPSMANSSLPINPSSAVEQGVSKQRRDLLSAGGDEIGNRGEVRLGVG
jgi:hypothetical protein